MMATSVSTSILLNRFVVFGSLGGVVKTIHAVLQIRCPDLRDFFSLIYRVGCPTYEGGVLNTVNKKLI